MHKLTLLILCSSFIVSCSVTNAPPTFTLDDRTKKLHGFYGYYHPIPPDVQTQMQRYTWRSNCPVSIDRLSYVKLSYWGFDNKTHEGTLIVNRNRAKEILEIFQVLYYDKFPIRSIKIIEDYQGNDSISTAANNTTAFNCRAMANYDGYYSLHSYGWAVDINPIQNPFIDKQTIAPAAGKAFLDRTKNQPGMISKNSNIYNAFTKRGWIWGGDWPAPAPKDYQHFEKPDRNFVKPATPT